MYNLVTLQNLATELKSEESDILQEAMEMKSEEPCEPCRGTYWYE